MVVALNRFITDTDAEINAVRDTLASVGVDAIPCTHWSDGGAGTGLWPGRSWNWSKAAAPTSSPLRRNLGLLQKIEAIARNIYDAEGVVADQKVLNQIKAFEAIGAGTFPVCIAKTQYSFSIDPNAKGAPSGHTLPIREVRLSNGAEFIVAVCGDIMTMPGLPRVPAAEKITLNDQDQIEGLF